MQQLNLSLYIFRTVILAPGVSKRPLKCTMIIYKLDRKHLYSIQISSRLKTSSFEKSMKTTIQKYKYLHLYRLSVLHFLTVNE